VLIYDEKFLHNMRKIHPAELPVEQIYTQSVLLLTYKFGTSPSEPRNPVRAVVGTLENVSDKGAFVRGVSFTRIKDDTPPNINIQGHLFQMQTYTCHTLFDSGRTDLFELDEKLPDETTIRHQIRLNPQKMFYHFNPN
jgi:hypothetical protein